MSRRRRLGALCLVLIGALGLGFLGGLQVGISAQEQIRASEIARAGASRLLAAVNAHRYSEAPEICQEITAGRHVLATSWVDSTGGEREGAGEGVPPPDRPLEVGVRSLQLGEGAPAWEVVASMGEAGYLRVVIRSLRVSPLLWALGAGVLLAGLIVGRYPASTS